jgi:hypothetical protein
VSLVALVRRSGLYLVLYAPLAAMFVAAKWPVGGLRTDSSCWRSGSQRSLTVRSCVKHLRNCQSRAFRCTRSLARERGSRPLGASLRSHLNKPLEGSTRLATTRYTESAASRAPCSARPPRAMQRCQNWHMAKREPANYPFERQAGYVAILAGAASGAACIACVIANYALPARKFDYGKWAGVGGALGAAAALSWLASNGLLY